MRTASVGQRALALSLAFILVSCSATRPSVAAPTGPQDLASYVLVIKPQAHGKPTHEWVPVEDFEVAAPPSLASSGVTQGRIISVSSSAQDCWTGYLVCLNDCKASRTIFQVGPYVYDSKRYGRWSTGKKAYCNAACMWQYANCAGKPEAEPVEFEAVQPAVDWIKNNREKILVGTIVVIAGVAFVAIVLGSGGAGLALLPVAGGAAAIMTAIDDPVDSSNSMAVSTR